MYHVVHYCGVSRMLHPYHHHTHDLEVSPSEDLKWYQYFIVTNTKALTNPVRVKTKVEYSSTQELVHFVIMRALLLWDTFTLILCDNNPKNKQQQQLENSNSSLQSKMRVQYKTLPYWLVSTTDKLLTWLLLATNVVR